MALRREQRGWSQQELADIVGTTVQTVSRIERGELLPRDYLRCALVFALGCSVSDLWPLPADEVVSVALLRKRSAA